MMKDAAQKFKAIRYCVANGLVPFMEAVVEYSGDTGPAPSEITDVDVLAIRPADSAAWRRIVFDCKTVKTSPINRALWAKGLAAFISADESFVILTRPAPEAHRLASSVINVRLFSEEIFDVFATAANPAYGVLNSYVERPEAWDALSAAKAKYPLLRKHLHQLQSSGPMIVDAAVGVRALIGSLRRIEGELDPEKPEHRAIFLLTCMQLLLFLSELVRIFHNVFDPAIGKEKFEKTLRHYLWGGRENYEIRQRLKDAVAARRGTDVGGTYDLPGWDVFLEVFRSLLDAPTLVGTCCLPLQDLAFRELSLPHPDLDARAGRRLSANSRVRQFIGLATQYVSAASKVPKEFRSRTGQLIGSLTSAD